MFGMANWDAGASNVRLGRAVVLGETGRWRDALSEAETVRDELRARGSVVRAVQAILGAISCVLLGYAAKEFFNQRAGIIAALLLAIYPPAIFFDGLIQKSSLDLFLVTAILAKAGSAFLAARVATRTCLDGHGTSLPWAGVGFNLF